MSVTSQAFTGQGASTYVSVPMPTVIQHRMMAPQSAVVPSIPTHQKIGSAPACAVTTATNFYIQAANAHPASHTLSGMSTPTPTAISTASIQPGTNQAGNSSCSLEKLQQLTNGLEMIPPGSCNTMTPPPTAMTPPNHHPHATMTPPPLHQMSQNQPVRNLAASPSGIPPNLQPQNLGYHKYYQTNMNQLSGTVTPPIAQSRSGRNSTNVAVQHMQPTSSRVSPNVALNSNIMSYNPLANGYRMAAQQAPTVTGYITNTSYINNAAQIPMQMGVMNMAQPQYQDPTAIQRAQQNSMYTTFGYSGLLNGTMRR